MASLDKRTISEVEGICDTLFDKFKGSFLGPEFINPRKDKNIFISFKPHLSLPGIYTLSAKEEAAIPNREMLDNIIHIADRYIEAQRLNFKAQVLGSIGTFLLDKKNKKANMHEVIGQELSGLMGKLKDNLTKIVAAETNTAKNMGLLEGIVKINLLNGVQDPIVAFIGPNDSHVCEECKRVLYTKYPKPKVFLLSEVKSGYHKRGEDTASMSGMHPHCRHTLITLMPGFGFDGNGKLKYFKKGYNALEAQREP